MASTPVNADLPGRIIFLNGTSSAGKTTLARALHRSLGEPFCYYASDQLADAGFRPKVEFEQGRPERERFFDGFHRSIPAFASAGNNLILEHIVEEQSWADDLRALMEGFDVFWVGLHVPLDELERRERLRGDRYIGEAAYHLKTHDYCRYDLELNSTRPVADLVEVVISAWRGRGNLTKR